MFALLRSERYCNCLFIESFQLADKSCKAFPAIGFVRTEDTGEVFLTIKGDPGELPAVVVQEARGETDAASCSNIGERGVMICAVEVIDLP